MKRCTALVLATAMLSSCPNDDEPAAEARSDSDASNVSTAGRSAAGDDAGTDLACRSAQDRSLHSARAFCERCAASEPQLCCVVSGNCCAGELRALPRLDFEACADGAAACDVPADAFGEPTYRVRSFVPAASGTERSGLVLRGSVDARQRVRLQARMQASDPSACTGCAELVGIGLSLDPIANTSAPELSIVVSSQLSQVIVASGTKSLWSMRIDAQAHDYALERLPDGSARLQIDGRERAALRIALPDGALRAFVFGRAAAALGAAEHARIHSAEVASARCERTAHWQEREPVLEPERHAPSVIRIGGMRWLAYATGTGIEAASAQGDEPFAEAAFSLRPGEQAFDQRGVSDPEWVLEDSALALYYTAFGNDGRFGIGRVRFEGLAPGAIVERAPLLAASELGVSELLAPSVTRDTAGNLLLVALAIDGEGGRSLQLLRASATSPRRFERSGSTPLLRDGNRDYTALGSADITQRRGQYQVYFSAVSEGRWVSGLLVSSDLQRWLSAGTVLAAGPGRTFDAAGVQDPEAFADGDVFSLYYTAYAPREDGAPPPRQLGRVARTGGAICGGVECSAGKDCAPAAASCNP